MGKAIREAMKGYRLAGSTSTLPVETSAKITTTKSISTSAEILTTVSTVSAASTAKATSAVKSTTQSIPSTTVRESTPSTTVRESTPSTTVQESTPSTTVRESTSTTVRESTSTTIRDSTTGAASTIKPVIPTFRDSTTRAASDSTTRLEKLSTLMPTKQGIPIKGTKSETNDGTGINGKLTLHPIIESSAASMTFFVVTFVTLFVL